MIGYVGSLGRRLDLPLLTSISRLPVGPLPQTLGCLRNVNYVPRRSYQRKCQTLLVPAHLQAIDQVRTSRATSNLQRAPDHTVKQAAWHGIQRHSELYLVPTRPWMTAVLQHHSDRTATTSKMDYGPSTYRHPSIQPLGSSSVHRFLKFTPFRHPSLTDGLAGQRPLYLTARRNAAQPTC